MPSSPFEIEWRYLSHLPLRLQLPMLSTRVNKEYGTVELTATATAFQSSGSSLFCQLHIPSGNASIAPVQLATLAKQLTHIFLNLLMHPKLQRPTMDAWAPVPRPPSTVCQPRGRQQKKSRTPRGEITWNQVEIMRNQSRFPWNQARKSAQPSSPTHFYNVWRHFWGESRGNQKRNQEISYAKIACCRPLAALGAEGDAIEERQL